MSWQECVVDTDYEIHTEYPYLIRKKSNQRIVSEWHNGNGYIRICLNRIKYYKHVLVAKQFIPNPDNLPQVDHINNDRSDYHIENLRWCDNSINQRNRLSTRGIEYEWIDELPDDAIEVSDYNNHLFEDYYYSESLDRFMFDNGIKIRLLHINHKPNGPAFVNMNDIDNVQVKVCYSKFKNIYGF